MPKIIYKFKCTKCDEVFQTEDIRGEDVYKKDIDGKIFIEVIHLCVECGEVNELMEIR